MGKKIKWYDMMQYMSMLLMAVAMPISMNLGVWTAALLALTTIIKIVASRQVGNRTLSRPVRLALYAPIVYWLLHVVSLALGGDISAPLRVVELKAVLLIFPLCLLLSDTSYMNRWLIRGLFYTLWASCLVVFIYLTVVGIVRLAGGETLSAVTNSSFDTRHHAYVALYVVSALAYVYYELVHHWAGLYKALKVALVASVPLLILYVLLVNSRAGVGVMWGVFGLCCLHGLRLSWWRSLLLAALVAGYTLGAGALLPGYTNRLAETVNNVQSGDGDARLSINKATSAVSMDNMILGYGAGRYTDELADEYKELNYATGAECTQNAHNQYMESMLSSGIIGLLALLFFVSSPLWLAMATGKLRFASLLATSIVMVNLLVESMLERQMGLLFIGWFYAVIVLAINVEKNKFGQTPKK